MKTTIVLASQTMTWDFVRYVIDTGDHPPIRIPMRRIPHALLEIMEEEVKSLLQAGIIRQTKYGMTE